MISSGRQHIWAERTAFGPATNFALMAFGLLLALSCVSLAVFDTFTLPSSLFLVVSGFAFYGLHFHYPHQSLGLCNTITSIRAAMVALLSGAIIAPDPQIWLVFSIACVAFALDGCDGWFARRSGLTSTFGARFDMEIDALIGAVLAMILLASGMVGTEILLLGFARYAFVAASFFAPKLRSALPESLRRKTICVIQIATLIVLLCPLTPIALLHPLSWAASILLLWSFAKDSHWLLRQA